MTSIGYALSSEERKLHELVEQARMAESAGFEFALISDHFHPWLDEQGESPFVWSVLGAIAEATERIPIGTGVTCPTMRLHPAIVAHAAATSACLMPGRFFLGVGSGENLNEHILGDRWPSAEERIDMLEEAVQIMRELWKGEKYSHDGEHYVVDNARIYSCPDEPVPVLVSGFGPKATSLAARIGDGYVNTAPTAELLDQYTKEGGKGPKISAAKVCWGPDEAKARKLAFELWPTTGVPGELSQELPMPAHFEQACQLVNEDKVAETIVCGDDPQKHIELLKKYIDAGYDEIYVSQIGDEQEGWLDFYKREVLPAV